MKEIIEKIQFKHIVGIGVLIFAGMFLHGAMFDTINATNDKYAAQIVQAFLTILGLLVGYYWGSSDGSKKKDDAMIKASQTPTIPISDPKPIAPAKIDAPAPISETKDQQSNIN